MATTSASKSRALLQKLYHALDEERNDIGTAHDLRAAKEVLLALGAVLWPPLLDVDLRTALIRALDALDDIVQHALWPTLAEQATVAYANLAKAAAPWLDEGHDGKPPIVITIQFTGPAAKPVDATGRYFELVGDSEQRRGCSE